MDPELERDVGQFWSLLFEIVADAEKRVFAYMAQHNLTPPQFFVLRTLTQHGGRCKIGQIAHEHHLTNATMTGLIKRLEAMTPPLVKRERAADDGRSVDVLLTAAGEERFWAVMAGFIEHARTVLGLLSPQERREAIEKVQLYFRMLVEQFPIASPQ